MININPVTYVFISACDCNALICSLTIDVFKLKIVKLGKAKALPIPTVLLKVLYFLMNHGNELIVHDRAKIF